MKIAAIQTNVGSDIQANIEDLEKKIREAANNGAEFIATPENSDFILSPTSEKIAVCPIEGEHPLVPAIQALCSELKVRVLIGSISVKQNSGKMRNRSYLISHEGEIIAQYDKNHLFDVSLPNGEGYKESEYYEAGEKLVLADTHIAKIGLSICYDVRFPNMYRQYAKNGAQILTVPSAFTVPTGEAHWESLLRARAIENGAYVIAPAQTGEHHGGRKTYGHSLIIDPWGKILADAGKDVGIIYADIDLTKVEEVRQSIPSLQGN